MIDLSHEASSSVSVLPHGVSIWGLAEKNRKYPNRPKDGTPERLPWLIAAIRDASILNGVPVQNLNLALMQKTRNAYVREQGWPNDNNYKAYGGFPIVRGLAYGAEGLPVIETVIVETPEIVVSIEQVEVEAVEEIGFKFTEAQTFGAKPKADLSEAEIASGMKARAVLAAKQAEKKALREANAPVVLAKPKRKMTPKMAASGRKARLVRAAIARAKRFAVITQIPETVTPEVFHASLEETAALCAGSATGASWVEVLHERQNTIRSGVKGNLTSQWLAKNGKEIFTMLVDHLSHKLPTSRRVSVIEDHVQTFLCRLVEKDTLASHLAAGKTPLPSVLRIWAWQSACTEMRGWGVDASLRKSRGAKTNRDRLADAGKLPSVIVQSPHAVIERRFEVENGEFVTDLHDPHVASVEDSLVTSDLLDRARELLTSRGDRSNRYRALVESLCENDEGRAALALEAGSSRSQMTAILARLREVVREEVESD